MQNDVSTALHQYWGQYNRCFRLSGWLVDKASSGLMSSEDNFRSILRATKLLLFGLSAITADAVETSRKRKKLCAILHCLPVEIAMDVNELVQKRESVKYYGGDFTYSTATPKEWLKNIRMIFGDAHLEALDDMTCLGQLKSVWGNLYVSRCTNHTVLEELAFIKGNISYQGKLFLSLQEFQRFLHQ